MSWPMVKLSDVATINPRLPRDVDESQQVTFVAMASASEDGYLLASETRILSETRKGFTYFDKNDVLLAKITPCFENGKCLRPGQIPTEIGFGSTEFHVIRPDTERLDSLYLFYLVWNEQFRFLGEKSMSGAAGQKRVGSDFLKGFEIPLPPLAEQKRIAAILVKADAIRRKRQQAIQLADDFLRAVFLDMFELSALETVNLGSLCNVKGGKRLPQGHDYSEQPTTHPYIRVVDFQGGTVQRSKLKYIDEATYSKISSYTIASNDVYISIAGTVGVAGVVPDDLSGANLTENAAKLVLKDSSVLEAGYLAFWLSTSEAQKQIRSKTMLTSQPKLALFRIEELLLPLPEIHEQRKFLLVKNKIHSLLESMEHDWEAAGCLFEAISQKAFSGQL